MEVDTLVMIGIGFTILMMILISMALLGLTIETTDFSFKVEMINPVTEVADNILEDILRREIIDKKVEGWNCLDYATYYNKTLSEKYPRLDIRFPRNVDICNNLTICDSYHTFLVVAGYGSECILDQRHLACISIIKNNQTKEEYDEIKWW